MDTAVQIAEAKKIFSAYLEGLRSYSLSAYDDFSDEAEITSTRRDSMTLRWVGRKFKELIGPSLDTARTARREYELVGRVAYTLDGDSVILSGEFVPSVAGQSGKFSARVRRDSDGKAKFFEFHDGQPVSNAIRLQKAGQEATDDGGIDIQMKPQ